MARSTFRPVAVASATMVRFDTASGSNTPADVTSAAKGSSSIPGSVLVSDADSGGLPVILGPDGVTTLYQKTLDYKGNVTATATLTAYSSGVTTPYDPSVVFAPLATDSPYPRSGPRTWILGDSITVNGVNTSTPNTWESRAWYIAASIAAEGKFVIDGIAATGGFTTTQVLATHVPTVLAAKPAMCVVLCGRNDVVNVVPWATVKANLLSMYTQLIAAGVMPVPCTLTANTGNTSAQASLTDQINNFIRIYAAAHKLPVMDVATLTNTTAGGQVTGWFADASHPNAVGAKGIGAFVATQLASILPPFTPPVAIVNSSPTTDFNLVTNPLFLTDTNADGTPDNFTVVAGSATGSVALVAGTGSVRGNYMVVSRSGGTGIYYAKMAASAPVVAGRRMALSLRLKATVEAGSAQCFVRAVHASNTTVYAGISEWAADIAEPGLFYTEFVVPAGVTNINIWAGLSAGTGSISVAQLSFRDLTAQDSL
ncbi:MAG: hypothetical protein JWM93_109 [Frankiales bacterium]|nr:hypothetical protein [Frankiales bacterium]